VIANGTRVLFTDRRSYGKAEPHSGQVGTTTGDTGDGFTLVFADGQTTWAHAEEVTVL